MVIQRPEFNGLVLCRELRLCVFADLAEAVDASEGNEGCPLSDELADKLLDSVSPAIKRRWNHAGLINDMQHYKNQHEEVSHLKVKVAIQFCTKKGNACI